MGKNQKILEQGQNSPEISMSDNSKKIKKMKRVDSITFEMYEKYYQNAKLPDEKFVDKNHFKYLITKQGILKDDPRVEQIFEKLDEHESNKLDKEAFVDCIYGRWHIVEQAMAEKFVIPDFPKFQIEVQELFQECAKNNQGKVADYIPELAKADPNDWGVSVCTIDGQRSNYGDTKKLFSVQSTSKPISYAMALEDLGPNKVHGHVGLEPSGVSFNAITLNPKGLPHNPLINSGAIMVCSLIKPELEESARFSYVSKFWSRLAGGKRITYDNTIFLSERNTADTNHALAYQMKSTRAFPEGTDIKKVLEFYFMCCSLQADTDTMSIIAATLANGGICPLTGDRVLDTITVKNVLSIMNSCGMYDYSGEFAFKVGLPAKSGVSGAVMIIVPGVMGICTYSPKLDQYGNSAKGVQFCEQISKKYALHYFQIDKNQTLFQKKTRQMDMTQNLLHLSALGDIAGLKCLGMEMEGNLDLEQGDYDGRSPLHLACSEGHMNVVKFLHDAGLKNLNPTDRWGNTPLDDAIRGNFEQIIQFGRNYGAKTGDEIRNITK